MGRHVVSVCHDAACTAARGVVSIAAGPAGPAAEASVAPVQSGLVAGPGDDFEVVKLKYADVSEIVGLLTGNQTIKSNDDFTPEETEFRLRRQLDLFW